MATLNGIDLTDNVLWANEFDGSAIDRETKYTEDGRQFVFQRKKQKFKKLTIDGSNAGLVYSTVQALEAIRDSGQVVQYVHNDNRVFNVLLETIEATPEVLFNEYDDTNTFGVILTLQEV